MKSYNKKLPPGAVSKTEATEILGITPGQFNVLVANDELPVLKMPTGTRKFYDKQKLIDNKEDLLDLCKPKQRGRKPGSVYGYKPSRPRAPKHTSGLMDRLQVMNYLGLSNIELDALLDDETLVPDANHLFDRERIHAYKKQLLTRVKVVRDMSIYNQPPKESWRDLLPPGARVNVIGRE